MALTFAAKPASAVYTYSWLPPLAPGDSITTATMSAQDAVLDAYTIDGEGILLTLSGGTAGGMAIITASAETSNGETLVETIYVPIIASTNAFSYTARDVCAFALRKITGNGEDASADELADAIERLNDMLAAWSASGGETSIPLPVDANSILYAPDGIIQTIKYNLRVNLHENYGEPLAALDVETARNGLKRLKQAGMPDDRAAADYY